MMRRRWLLAVALACLGCRPGKPCHEAGCDSAEDGAASQYEVECADLDTWASGIVTHLTPLGSGTLVAGARAQDPLGASLPWLGLVDSNKTLVWELEPADDGSIWGLVEVDDHVALLRTYGADAYIEEVDGSGAILSSKALSMPEGDWALLGTMARTGDTLLVGGTSQEDFLVARVGANGLLDIMVREDHAGFVDTVVALTPTDSGFVAVVHAPTTTKWVDDVGIPQATDILVLFFDEQGTEVHRENLASDEEVSAAVAIPLDGGDVIVAGDTAPIIGIEPGDRSAWAARVSSDGVVWREEWSGPEVGELNTSAGVEAAHLLDSSRVVLGGGQVDATGLRRWHVIVDVEDGRGVDEELGGPAMDFLADSYRASGPTPLAYFAGTTWTSKGDVQWLCEFVER